MSNEVCGYCRKPVIPFVEATYGTSGNHYDCREKAQLDLAASREALDRVKHVIEWYQLLGSPSDVARARAAQELKLIQRRNNKK